MVDARADGARVTRRQLGLAAGAVAGTALGAACGIGGEQPAARTQQPVKLQLWTFPVTHFNYFKELAPVWQQKSRIEVEPTHVTASGGQSWADKYQVAIASDTAPDLADIEQGSFGRFLRGDVPMVEIGDRLKKEGFWDKLIATRQALYTWKGKNYGVEHALTPVVLYYRRDLFDRVGIKAESLKTWDDYVEVGKKMVSDDLQFHMFGFDAALRQRGSDYFNENGQIAADTPAAGGERHHQPSRECRYARRAAGARGAQSRGRTGAQPARAGGLLAPREALRLVTEKAGGILEVPRGSPRLLTRNCLAVY